MQIELTHTEKCRNYLGVLTSPKGVKELKRTCVHAMPRASLCTITSMCGAFALLVVGALNLGGLYE